MNRLRSTAALQAALALAIAFALPAQAQQRTTQPRSDSPQAPVYIVSSRATFESGLRSIAQNPSARFDSTGQELVISRLRAYQVSDLARHIHEKENRCGGFFAFDTVAQAEAFIRNDRSARASNTLVANYTIDNQATVNPWLSRVDESKIYDTINHLQSYQNRYYTSTTGKSSAQWIKSKWDSLAVGRSDVTSELFNCSNCSTQPSVIMTVQGGDLASEVVIIGAHLDSINGSGGGSNSQVAPGADDDASGVATVTEVIRIALANGWKPRRTVKFMAYAAEEVGLRGSNAIAQKFKNDGVNVVGVLQMDMTNYKSGNPEDMQVVTDYSNAALKTFFNNLFDTYLAPLGLRLGTITCGYGCSDHASWTSAGYPAGMMFEAGDNAGANTPAFRGTNPKIHTTGDTLAFMGESAEPSVNFAKFSLAFIGEMGKTATGPGNQAPVANFTASTNGLSVAFTDSSSDSDGSIASRSWNFGDGTTSTVTNPSKTYSAAGTYTVTLKVTDNGGATNTKTASVTVSSAGGGSVLSNGVTKTGISGASGSSQIFTLAVPAGASNLKFASSGGTGDADMYVKFNGTPTTTSYDCKSTGSNNTETCNIASAQTGTYSVLIKAYSAFSGMSLTGSYTAGGGGGAQTYSNPADVTIIDKATVDSPITVSGRTGNAPSNASVTVAIVHTYIGDLKVDLVAPDGTLYNIHNRSGGSADNIYKTVTLNLSSEALNGTWKLRVNDNASNDTGKIDSWSVTF